MTQAKRSRLVAAPRQRATAVPVGTRSVTALGRGNERTNQSGLGNSAPLFGAAVLRPEEVSIWERPVYATLPLPAAFPSQVAVRVW